MERGISLKEVRPVAAVACDAEPRDNDRVRKLSRLSLYALEYISSPPSSEYVTDCDGDGARIIFAKNASLKRF